MSKRRHEKGDTPAGMAMHLVMPDLIGCPVKACSALYLTGPALYLIRGHPEDWQDLYTTII